jgi:hypothetical protein
MRKPKNYRFEPLPSGFDPLDCTIDECAAYRRESRWTVHKKIREGVYESYLDGRIRKIIFASVRRDRENAIKAGATAKKRRPGRPFKRRAEKPSQVAAE